VNRRRGASAKEHAIDFSQLYPGRFVKAGDLKGRDVTMQISDVAMEELEGDDGKRAKAIISFAGAKKQLVLNRTNGLCLRAMFGRETDAWLGRRVTLYPAPNPDSARGFGDEICIRVRGSPDIERDIAFDCRPGRKKAARLTMVRTPEPKGAARAGPAPAPVTSRGEPPPEVPLPTDL
jgi:hypothetical protein